MAKFLDVETGEVHIGQEITLYVGATPQQLRSVGLMFVRDFDMGTGWVFRTAGPISIASHAVQLALGFYRDELRKLCFGFVENPDLDLDELFGKHNEFLRHELGSPSFKNNRIVDYKYQWGEIASESDLRGGGSSIWVMWK